MVEYGFARFGNVQGIVADEPLALLAAVHYFMTETSWSFRHFMKDSLSTSNDSSRGLAFEHFGAFLLALAFKSPTRLSSVFNFTGPNDVENEYAQLVALHKTGEGFMSSPVDIFSSAGPTYALGYTARTQSETLSWLKDPKRTVFCFPVKTIGPDGILVLRLSDGRVVRVLVQFKQPTMNTYGPEATRKAFESTDPINFLSRISVRPITQVLINLLTTSRSGQNRGGIHISPRIESRASGRFA